MNSLQYSLLELTLYDTLMSDSRIYLNVPYAQKDAAKALGARWDPANKKWYVQGKDDVSLFSDWLPVNYNSEPVSVKSTPSNDIGQGVITYPVDTAFFAYNGDTPPWA